MEFRQFNKKSPFINSSGVANCNISRFVLIAVSTMSAWPRSSSEAHSKAPPSFLTALMTTSRSAFISSDAQCKAPPLCDTACSTTSLSPLRDSWTNFNAMPSWATAASTTSRSDCMQSAQCSKDRPLQRTAFMTISLSAFSSAGASCSNHQCPLATPFLISSRLSGVAACSASSSTMPGSCLFSVAGSWLLSTASSLICILRRMQVCGQPKVGLKALRVH
mmetsp:Transcript_29981/g.54622  ORF Transcript_29981/g.54622 Transcript_29981/m.54622 type:complete len:220 (-) Transcript_29981:95-754(-)